MLRRSLNDIACGLAAHVRKNLPCVERGAVPVRLVEDAVGPLRVVEGGAVIGIFGNDNYIAEANSRREVELTRQRLRQMGAEEAGFGLSQDGYTWALLVRCTTAATRPKPAGRCSASCSRSLSKRPSAAPGATPATRRRRLQSSPFNFAAFTPQNRASIHPFGLAQE